MHLDGGGSPTVAFGMLKRLERMGAVGKINTIIASVAGPQRQLMPDVYASHTPATGDGTERFEYFSTVSLGSRENAIQLLRQVLPDVAAQPGVVLEVERVVARIDDAGRLTPSEVTHGSSIDAADVGIAPSPTARFEVHHAFDIPFEGVTDLPIDLAQLLRDTSPDVVVGGWFCFARKGFVSYRSNAFTDRIAATDVQREHAALAAYLQTRHHGCRIRTVVEEVLGIWHTGQP
jgi:hypothetical protein